MQADVIVIGAGAAGLLCAGIAGQRGRRVVVLDHAHTIGEKIRISGGGRCNFTNRDSRPENFLSLNPAFVKSALARYTPQDFIALVRSYRIGFHEKHHGQLFCDDRATQIVAMLQSECAKGGVELRHPVSVESIGREGMRWVVRTSAGVMRTEHLVMATGGLPVPAIGATAFALEVARQFGLRVTDVRPGLVPLAFTDNVFAQLGELSGVSLPARVCAGVSGHRYGHACFDDDLLITHKGLSGPAMLQASSYWCEGEEVSVQWVLNERLVQVFADPLMGAKTTEAVLMTLLPERLARSFADHVGLLGRRWAEIGRRDRERLSECLTHWCLKPAGTLGWKKAEVMVGGVDTRDLNSKTMAANGQPGLFFIGECVDVTGHLGGHNFQWAWASAHACAMAI